VRDKNREISPSVQTVTNLKRAVFAVVRILKNRSKYWEQSQELRTTLYCARHSSAFFGYDRKLAWHAVKDYLKKPSPCCRRLVKATDMLNEYSRQLDATVNDNGFTRLTCCIQEIASRRL